MAGRSNRLWSTWNLRFGVPGIQLGWGLQMAKMSAIYGSLDAGPDQIPPLELAAPLPGRIAPRAGGGRTTPDLPAQTGCRFSVGRPGRDDH